MLLICFRDVVTVVKTAVSLSMTCIQVLETADMEEGHSAQYVHASQWNLGSLYSLVHSPAHRAVHMVTGDFLTIFLVSVFITHSVSTAH